MNKRVVMVGLIGMTFFLLAHRPAFAMAELCPATLKYAAVGQSAEASTPAALYGIELSAPQPRTITSATLAFDTSAGWYTATTGNANLTSSEGGYTVRAPNGVFRLTRRDYVSPVMYVSFPRAITIAHAWVYSATAGVTSSTGLGVVCPPPAPQQNGNSILHLEADSKEDAALTATPGASAVRLKPIASTPLESSNCAVPFRAVSVKTQALAEPVRDFLGDGVSIIDVTIDSGGRPDNIALWHSANSLAVDNSAITAARESTYVGGRAYCQDVPSTFLFIVTYS